MTAVPDLPAVESYAERVRAALAQRRALAEAATAGSWEARDDATYKVGHARGPSPRDESGFSDEWMGRVLPGYGGTVYPWDARFIAANDPAHVLELIDKQEAAVGLALDGLRRHSGETNVYGETVCSQHGIEQASDEPDEPWPCPDALAYWSVLTGIGMTFGVTTR
jgi:hypothetical protein